MATMRPALEAEAAPVEAGGWLAELGGGDTLFEAELLAVGAAVVVVTDSDEVLAAEVVMLPLNELETETEFEADWLAVVVLGGANGTVGGIE